MALLYEEDFNNLLINGKILYFSCSELNTPEPHYFILISTQQDGTILLSCATSQIATIQKIIDRHRFAENTFVFMPNNDVRLPFTKQTFINCNEYFPYSFDELWEKYLNNELEIKGDLPMEYYQQIIIGFNNSEMIEEDVKEILPNPDNL